MELVILDIGLDTGIISSSVFSMMVIMALSTTRMTTPMLHFLYKRQKQLASFHALGTRKRFISSTKKISALATAIYLLIAGCSILIRR